MSLIYWTSTPVRAPGLWRPTFIVRKEACTPSNASSIRAAQQWRTNTRTPQSGRWTLRQAALGGLRKEVLLQLLVQGVTLALAEDSPL